jgi:hypothetical protein
LPAFGCAGLRARTFIVAAGPGKAAFTCPLATGAWFRTAPCPCGAGFARAAGFAGAALRDGVCERGELRSDKADRRFVSDSPTLTLRAAACETAPISIRFAPATGFAGAT